MITEALIAALTSLIAGMTGVSQVFIELFYRKRLFFPFKYAVFTLY